MISLSILLADTLPVLVFQGIGTSSFLSSVRSVQEKKSDRAGIFFFFVAIRQLVKMKRLRPLILFHLQL